MQRRQLGRKGTAFSKRGARELGGWGWRGRKKQGLVSLRPKADIQGRFKKEHNKPNTKGPLKPDYPASENKSTNDLPSRTHALPEV